MKIMGFHHPPYPVCIKRCVKDVEMITWKRLAQLIGEKKLIKINDNNNNNLPFGGRKFIYMYN